MAFNLTSDKRKKAKEDRRERENQIWRRIERREGWRVVDRKRCAELQRERERHGHVRTRNPERMYPGSY